MKTPKLVTTRGEDCYQGVLPVLCHDYFTGGAVAVLTGGMLTLRGSAWGLAVGVIMHVLVEKVWEAKKTPAKVAAD